MTPAVFFDCDGVILDSNRIKTEAFRTVGRRWDAQAAERLVEYHIKHGGISRFEKFRFFFEELLASPEPEEAKARALEFYASLVRRELLSCPLIPGVRQVLEHFRARGVSCWVVSGGLEEEVRWVLEEKGLAEHFEEIRGSPATKAEIVEDILGLRGPFDRMLFLGDSASDHQTAMTFGMEFVFVSAFSEWSGPPAGDVTTTLRVADFREFLAFLPLSVLPTSHERLG